MTGAASGSGGRDWRTRLVLLVLVLASFALHMWRLDAKSIWWDESLSLHRAQGSIGYILSNRISLAGAESIDQHPPLFFLVLSAFLRCCGDSDFTLRFPSVAFATLLVPLLYVMAKRLRGRRAGLLAGLLGVLSPFYLWYAQEARMYTMVTALGLAALYCVWRAVEERRLTWAGGWVFLSAAGIGTHYLYLLLLVFHLLIAATLWPRRHRERVSPAIWRRPVVIVFTSILALALVMVGQGAVHLLLRAAAGRRYIPLGLIIRDAYNSFTIGLSASLRQAWPLDLAFTALYCLGIISIWRHPPSFTRTRWSGTLALGAYVFLPILGMWAYSLFRSIYMGSRYIIMASPASYLGVGIGLDHIYGRKRLVGGLLVCLLVLGMGVSNYRFFTHERYRTKEDHRSSAEYVMARESQGDLIILTAPENIAAFEHYYSGQAPIVTMPRVALDPNFDRARLARDMAEAVAGYRRVWFVHCRTQHSDPTDQVRAWLDANATLLSHKRFPSWGSSPVVNLYYPGSPVVEGVALEREPLGVFGGRLSLVDYALHYRDQRGFLRTDPVERDADGVRAPISDVPSGGYVTVVFDWHTLDEVPNVKLSLRLLGEHDLIWAQSDRELFRYPPTNVFAANSQIEQEMLFRIPPGTPRGDYSLHLGIYDPAGGAEQAYMWAAADGSGEGSFTLCLARLGIESPGHPATDPDLPKEAEVPAVRLVYGPSLELLAYSLGPRERHPDDKLELRLSWRALGRLDDDLRLAINWRDESGHVWHTSTHNLTGLDRTSGPWERGELIRGVVRLQVPAQAATGSHQLHLLVHDGAQDRYLWLRRGWVLWGGRDLPLGEIIVQ